MDYCVKVLLGVVVLGFEVCGKVELVLLCGSEVW